MRKGWVWALVLVLGILLLAGAALGEDAPKTYTSGDWKYTLQQDGTACIKRWEGNSVNLSVPDTLDGIAVTGIGDGAFDEGTTLISVTIPDSVTSIGSNPFTDCKYLRQVIISPDQPILAVLDGVLCRKASKQIVWYPQSAATKSYTIPQGIASIGENAFYSCDFLKSITIPDTVTSIENYAFHDCDYLTHITIPDGVTSIGANPFRDCDRLQWVTVSPDHPILEDNLGMLYHKTNKQLIWCPVTKNAVIFGIPQGTASIGDSAFYKCDLLKSITIPDSVTHIGYGAFSGCDSLTNITIPRSVTSIGTGAFYNCDSLTSVTIQDGVTSIGDMAFAFCKSLTNITIPEGVTRIGSLMFYRCNALPSITIPDSVTSIGKLAFNQCDSLTSLSIPNGVTSIGDYAFYGCPNLTLTVSRDSYAAQYAKDNGLQYVYPDSFDWLNQ